MAEYILEVADGLMRDSRSQCSLIRVRFKNRLDDEVPQYAFSEGARDGATT